jgi:arabinogalactan oligomer/maltooligosaccharide transport system substrate-binding protein
MTVTRTSLARWATLATVAAATVALTGCTATSSGGSDGSASISVWVDTERMPALKDVAASFTKDTGIEVKLVVKDFKNIGEDFISQVPTGKGPDILVTPHDKIGSYVKNGVVAPLELGDTASKYAASAISAVTYQGTVYGLPYSIENIALVRNTALAPEASTTFDEVVAHGRAAMAAAPGTVTHPIVIGLDPKNADPYHLYPLQSSFGSGVFAQSADGSYDPSALTLGDESGQAFAAALATWGADGTIDPDVTSDIALDTFTSGAGAYYITGPWNLPAIKKAGIDYAIDPLPSAGGQPARPFLGVNAFVISAKSDNTVAATKFLVDYVGSDSAQMKLYEVGGRPPALLTAYETAAASDPDIKALAEAGAEGQPMPAIPEMAAVWNDWGVAEAQILRGSGDPRTVWSQMAINIAAKLR